MQKQAPTLGRLAVMILFALSTIGLLLFLWLSFGGEVPLKSKRYEVKVALPKAFNLATQADVREAGINIGKVVAKKPAPRADRTLATLAIDSKYAPIRRGAQATIRLKTLLGENYVAITPGRPKAPAVQDGARLPDRDVHSFVELPDIYQIFDPRTRAAYRSWQQELAKATHGRAYDLSNAVGNLPPFAQQGNDLLGVLDRQRHTVRALVNNTAATFAAITRNATALHNVIVDADTTFTTTAARQRALVATFHLLPGFLDQSKTTLARLRGFAQNTDPLVRQLTPDLRQAVPALRATRRFAPDLRAAFTKLGPVIRAGRRGLPATSQVLHGLGPLADAIHPFLAQLNPVLQWLEQNQGMVSDFLTQGITGISQTVPISQPGRGDHQGHYLRQFSPVGLESLGIFSQRPAVDRGNTYIHGNQLLETRTGDQHLMPFPNFDCRPSGGPRLPSPLGPPLGMPGCYIATPSGFQGYNGRYPHVSPDHYKPGPH